MEKRKSKFAEIFFPILGSVIVIIVLFTVDLNSLFNGNFERQVRRNFLEETPPARQENLQQNKYNRSGYNMDVLKLDLNKGVAVFDLIAKGTGDYQAIQVTILRSDGSLYDLAFNEADYSYSGKIAIEIKETGTYIVNVEINGTWTLAVY